MQPIQKTARLAGLLYLGIIIFGLIAQVFVRDELVDYNNATITANNILASETWYRFGFVSGLLMLACDIGVTTIFYLLFKNIRTATALLATFFRVASIIILAVVALTHYGALFLLGDPQYLLVFTASQREALALLSVKLHGAGYNVSLLFFGFHMLLLGYLMYVSRMLPRVLGLLIVLGGACYIINSLTWFLWPAMVKWIYPAILIPCSLGELLLAVWLLVKGVKSPQMAPSKLGNRVKNDSSQP